MLELKCSPCMNCENCNACSHSGTELLLTGACWCICALRPYHVVLNQRAQPFSIQRDLTRTNFNPALKPKKFKRQFNPVNLSQRFINKVTEIEKERERNMVYNEALKAEIQALIETDGMKCQTYSVKYLGETRAG